MTLLELAQLICLSYLNFLFCMILWPVLEKAYEAYAFRQGSYLNTKA